MKKWFKIKGKQFYSIKTAKNIEDAWDKTLQKWSLVESGYEPVDENDTCGICDLFYKKGCCFCFLYFHGFCNNFNSYYGGKFETWDSCVPFNDPSEQLLWLLFVKEATK